LAPAYLQEVKEEKKLNFNQQYHFWVFVVIMTKKLIPAMKNILFAFFILLTVTAAVAQTPGEATIAEKFQELITNSNNFKGYKVVDTDQLTTLQELTSNRIIELKEEIATSKETLKARDAKIATLEAELENLKEQLATLSAEKDEIAVLGMSLSKATYNTAMWSLVGILVLALALFVVRFKRSHIHTAEARKNLAELEKEFDAYRAKSLEKEQRLGRLLQDEKNKQLKVAK
jgi:preprotein translocase subunit SecF